MTQAVAPTFTGFDPAHTTPIPDALIDELLIVLSWDELKVFLYIARRTKGFGKEKDAISLAQFTDGITTRDGRVLDRGCGIKNRARVVDARGSLKERGYINFEQVARGNGHGATVYSICYRGSDASVPSQSSDSDATVPTTSDATVPTTSDATVPTTSDATVPHNKQLTVNSKQKTVIQKSNATNVATPTPSSPLEKPQGKPERPGDDMSWSPEKLVRITEYLRFCGGERGAYFQAKPTGKNGKSQRDRQLAAAKKIFAGVPNLTQDEYIAAYSEQNNEWWNRERGSLTVEDMAANTPRKVMRVVELLEKVQSRSANIKKSPPQTTATPQVGQLPDNAMDEDEAVALALDALRQAKEHGHTIKAQPQKSSKGNYWIVRVTWWDTAQTTTTIKSRSHWKEEFEDWQKEPDENLPLEQAERAIR